MLPFINTVSLFLMCERRARFHQDFFTAFIARKPSKVYHISHDFPSTAFTVSKRYLLRVYESTRISSNRNILLSESRVFFFIDCN